MIIEYDRESAVKYAIKYALDFNPEFYHFEGVGGDCTNYISQCLLAGNGVMNYDKYYGWFYISSYNRSPSWTSVEYLEKFLINNIGVGPFGHIANRNTIKIGDLIQLRQNPFRFNHTLIITKIENNEIYVCAHSNDTLNKKLREYNFLELKYIHIDGIRV